MKAQMVCLGFEPRTAGWQAQTNPMSYVGPQKIVLNVTPKRSSIQGMSLQWLYLQLYLQRMPERLATDVICFKVCTNECECFDPLSCRDRIFHLKLALAVVERLRPDDRISTPLSLSLSLSLKFKVSNSFHISLLPTYTYLPTYLPAYWLFTYW